MLYKILTQTRFFYCNSWGLKVEGLQTIKLTLSITSKYPFFANRISISMQLSIKQLLSKTKKHLRKILRKIHSFLLFSFFSNFSPLIKKMITSEPIRQLDLNFPKNSRKKG